jgi:predicted ATPase
VHDAGGVDALPDSIGSLVTARVDRLPPAQRDVLREVSVLGYSFPPELAADALPSAAGTGFDGLEDFLLAEGGVVRFRHAMIRDAAYESLPYRRRRRHNSHQLGFPAV